MKKTKVLVFIAVLLVLFVGICIVSATDVSDDTTQALEKQVPQTYTDSVNKPIKDIKNEVKSMDYYVSDTSGSDDNGGTSTSPFKTIQTALDKTSSEGTYNIHIAEGMYKGLGNTNLTVNGNHTINIIGDGINKTVLDGEASYTITGGDVWGSDPYWDHYQYNGGNWGLNITRGDGLVTITGLNIQNMISPGGSSISAYETSTVDNYANLVVDGVYFKDNMAGVGGGIRNNNGTTLLVNNSVFDGNRKSTSTGNDGGAIYNNGTAVVENSLFIRNAGRWGTILNDHVLNITNSTLRDGISYDLASTYKMGSGIAIDSGNADYFNPYTLEGIVTNIMNCTFINNGQTDVYHGGGKLLINNSVFRESSGVYVSSGVITNNIFENMIPSTLFGDLSSSNTVSFAIYGGKNVTIRNNTLSTMGRGSAIILRFDNNLIEDNMIYDSVELESSNNTVINNVINVTSNYAVMISGRNNIVANNSIESLLFYGNEAVRTTGRNIIENNTPNFSKGYIITNENYDNYFDKQNVLYDNITDGAALYLAGNFINKVFIFNNDVNLSLTGYGDLLLSNCRIILNGTGNVIVNNITMNTTKANSEYQLLVNSGNNEINNSKFYANTTGKIHAIIINGTGNTFNGNMIYTCGPSNNISYDLDNYGIADTISLLIQSSGNTIRQNNITTIYTTNQSLGTIMAISIQTKDDITENNVLQNNRIYATGDDYVYAINMFNTHQNNITQTNINITSNNYAKAIQMKSSVSQNKITANIYIYAPNTQAIIVDGSQANNNDLSNTQILMANTTNMTCFEINNANNTNLNAIIVQLVNTTTFNMIKLYNSTNTNIISNTLYEVNPKDSVNSVIILTNKSSNILINNSRLPANALGINAYDSSNIEVYDSTINTTEEAIILNNTYNVIIKSNTLLMNNQTIGGDNAVKQVNTYNVTLEDNKPTIINLTDSNYNVYFDEGIFKLTSDDTTIHLGSDLYNRNLTFNTPIKLLGHNHTLYNTTVNLTSTMCNIYDTNFNSTDNRETLLDSTYTVIYYSNFYQNNTGLVRTFRGTDPQLYYCNITIYGPEIETNDNMSSILPLQDARIYYSNINIHSTSSDNKGNISIADMTAMSYNNLNIDGKNVIGLLNPRVLEDNNIQVNGEKYAVGILYNNATGLQSGGLSSSNIKVQSPDEAIGVLFENVNFVGYSFNQWSWNNVTVLSNNTGSILCYDNITLNRITHLLGSSDKYYGENVNGIVINNLNKTRTSQFEISYNNLTINDTKDSIHVPVILNNSQNIQITRNNITTNKETWVAIVENCENITIRNNYLESSNYWGDKAVNTTNSNKILITSNTPGLLITDDNYNDYFVNDIYTGDITILELGSDIHNKSFIFNQAITLQNPNKYTIYNGTLRFNNNSNSTLNNTQINYSGNNEIILYGNIKVMNASITITGQNNTVLVTNNSYASARPSITYSDITLNGNNLTILYTEVNNPTFNYNNIIANTNNSNIMLPNTGYLEMNYNNVTIDGENNTIFMGEGGLLVSNTIRINTNTSKSVINMTTYGELYSNMITVNTTFNQTPVITVQDGYVWGNYIESINLKGNNAINNGTTIVEENMPTEEYNMANINVSTHTTMINDTQNTITVTVTDALGNPITTGRLTLLSNNKIISSTALNNINNLIYMPTNTGIEDLTISLQSDKYFAQNVTLTVEVKKLETTINVTPLTGYTDENKSLIINVIDAESNPVITGTITIKDDKNKTTTLTVTNGIATLENLTTPYHSNLTITFNENNGYYPSNTTTTIEIKEHIRTIEITPITATIGNPTNITVTITIDNQTNNINGKVYFKVDGKVLRDENNKKVIYVDVVDGIATLTDYIIPDNWNNETEIKATYTRTDQIPELTSQTVNPTITYPETSEPEFAVSDATATAGGEVNITVTTKNMDNGKVVLKVNGKTVKADDGKLYSKVSGEATTFTYTVPKTYKAGDYSIKAVYTAGASKLEADAKLTIA